MKNRVRQTGRNPNMQKDKSFHDYIVFDILEDSPNITSKAMFGGWAIYKDGIIFGIIIAGELYFKVGENNRSEFEKLESHPFVYAKGDGKPVTMSYWLVPDEVMENKERFYEFVEKSVAVKRKRKS